MIGRTHCMQSLTCVLFCKIGKRHKTCSSAVRTMDDAIYFLVIRLGPKTFECRKNVTVVFTVTNCDVTNCATALRCFNKHVSNSRDVPRCTEKIHKFYACSHVSIIRLVQFIIRSACNSSLSLVPVVKKLVSLSSIPIPKIDPDLWNRSRPSACVPMSLGLTSVMTDDIVSSFRNTRS